MLLAVLAAVVGLLVVSLLDNYLWRTLRVSSPAALEKKDWYQLFRQVGYLPMWLLISAALWLHDRKPRRAVLVFLSALLGGAAAELVKLATQRMRPGSQGDYVFRWATDSIPNADLLKGLGLASSHAGVAFGGAFMLAYLFPRVAPLAIGMALGCSLTRLLMGAHFATDVYVAALLSYAVFAGLRKLDLNLTPAT